MDKLRAIQYFIAAAEEGSLTGAARRLEVSVPAVRKLLGSLERELGVLLFDRSVQGVKLTTSGDAYLDCCRPLLSDLDAAETALARSAERPSGTLVVAAHPQLAHHLLLPALPEFHRRYPDIQVDFRTVHRISDADAAAADVLLLHGWPEAGQDLIHRKLGMARTLIVAAPEYWASHGVPRHPDELTKHICLLMRNPPGIVLDLWEFERDRDKVSVPVNGWLISNAREVVLDAVIGGEGIGRFSELTIRAQMHSGRLVPVLLDWEVQGGPPLNLLYKASARRTPRARLFIDFTIALLRQHEAAGETVAHHPSTDRPAWHRRGYGRASSALRRGA